MRPRFVGVTFILFGLLAAAVFGLVVLLLWNRLMPPIFGLPVITFWQALGLLILSRILFGGLKPGRRIGRRRFVHGWRGLTPEERERFRQAMGAKLADRFRDGGGNA